MFSPFLWSLLSLPAFVASLRASPEELASQYSLTTSTSLPFPSATQKSSDSQEFIISNWGLSKGRIQDGAPNLQFVADPFSSARFVGSPVLQVTYPQGSYSHDTGGSQFYNLWNSSDSSAFLSMMVSYEVAFDQNFDFVKGGKLPGLRGGLPNGCSGGNEATGQDCFTARLMWRQQGAGEVYAYIPTPNGLCDERSITCNSDFGTSISRGSFILSTAQWHNVTLLVRLNDPPDVANGDLQLFYDGLQVATQGDLQLRSLSNVTVGGLYFSTFFGGSDDSWATPNTVHTYYRNLQLWGSGSPSNLAGAKVAGAAAFTRPSYTLLYGTVWASVMILLRIAF